MIISQPLPFNLHFFLFIKRKRWAYGIKSCRKGTDKWHNLLFDFDGRIPRHSNFDWMEQTPNGMHAVTLGQYSLERAFTELLRGKADRKYVTLGIKRGYWFLECYSLPPPHILHYLTTMRIKRF